eukprot:gene16372-19481_t
MNLPKGQKRHMQIMVSIVAAGFMFAGFVPQLYGLYRSRSSAGISKLFVCLDFMGGVFSIMSLVFNKPFDYLPMITYVIVPVFQGVQFGMLLYFDKFGVYKYRQEDIDLEATGAGGDLPESVGLTSLPEAHPFNTAVLITPLSTSKDLEESSKTIIETSLIRSSYILFNAQQNQNNNPNGPNLITTQEFDHICPDSESDTEESHLKQTIILKQTSALFGSANA